MITVAEDADGDSARDAACVLREMLVMPVGSFASGGGGFAVDDEDGADGSARGGGLCGWSSRQGNAMPLARHGSLAIFNHAESGSFAFALAGPVGAGTGGAFGSAGASFLVCILAGGSAPKVQRSLSSVACQ